MLRNRDFALLFVGAVIVQGTVAFQLVTPIFWVQEHAGDDVEVLLVGVLSAIRGVAMFTFGVYGGTLADRFDRRRVLFCAELAGLAVAAAIVAVAAQAGGGPGAMALLFLLFFFASGLTALDVPTRQAMIPDVVGLGDASRGVAMAAAGSWVVNMGTILVVGLVIDRLGFAGAFALMGALQAVAFASLLPMRYRRQEAGMAAPGLGGLREGLAYTRSQPVLRWLVGLAVLMTAISMPAISALGATWVTTVVGASFSEFGLIASFWGLGAVAASLVLARAAPQERLGAVVAGGAVLLASGFAVFGAGDEAAFAMVGNAAVGAGLATTQVAGIGLIAQVAPNKMRGRVTSVLLLDRALAQLLALPAAALAQVIGMRALFPALATACLVAVLSLVVAGRRHWRLGPAPLPAAP